jgi:uncharacterized membrane protein
MADGLTTIGRGADSRIAEPTRAIVRDEDTWRALWAAHAGDDPPPVDFSTRTVAAVFAGERPSAGHEIHIVGARRGPTIVTLMVEERTPPPGVMAAQVIVTPFHIVSMPRADGDVQFVDRGAVPESEPGAPRLSDTAPSSTGLDRNFAAALAYLAGPLSGMTILMAEQRNRYVRFHAWQAVLALGGLGLLALGLLAGAFAGLVLSPVVFTTLYRLAFVALAVWVVLWLALIVQALRGVAWRLPLVGQAAARRAGR